MFSYPCCFINGNMFTCLHESHWIVRLSEEDREALEAEGGKIFDPMGGRPMREYRILPPFKRPEEAEEVAQPLSHLRLTRRQDAENQQVRTTCQLVTFGAWPRK
jgi:TfoX N-terminal domain